MVQWQCIYTAASLQANRRYGQKQANQVSHLDFDVKVPTGSDDELGRLGNSINELSSKLELTISELKTGKQ